MAARIRKGDTVVVITGVNKGRRGEVLRVIPKADRAVVQGVAMVTRHVKPRGMQEPGGLRQQEAAIHLSNLMLVDPRSEKPTKVGFRRAKSARRESDGRSDRELSHERIEEPTERRRTEGWRRYAWRIGPADQGRRPCGGAG
jgi:large subunit ribosomal protein L24